MKTTINGQLFLLMLIEELYVNGIETYYANTDGISVSTTCVKDLDVIQDIISEWIDKYQLILEEDYFKASYIRDANNFINIKKSGSIKLKGAYEYTGYLEKYGEFDLTGSFDKPIVAYAAVQYFTKNIDIKETILNHISNYPNDGIYDFCIAKKVSSQFHNELFTIHPNKVEIKSIQQSVRYFVTKSNQKLFKVKDRTDRELLGLVNKSLKGKKSSDNLYFLSEQKQEKGIFIKYIEGKGYIYKIKQKTMLQSNPKKDHLHYDEFEADKNITLFNDYFKSKDYNIDYDYYLFETQKLINAIEKKIEIKKNEDKQLKLNL